MNAILESTKFAHQKNNKRYELKAETLIKVLRQRIKDDSDFLIFLDLKNRETKISASDVISNAESIAQYLLSKGMIKEDKVVVMLPSGVHFAYIYFGILMAGGIPIPVSQPAGTSNIEKYLDNLKYIIHDSEAKFFITYDKIRMLIGSFMNIPNLVKGFIFSSEIFQNPVPEKDYKELPEIKPSDLALIQYTSGTISQPKGVMLSHNNLLHNIHGIGVALEANHDDVGISWLPLYHDMGLIGGFFTCMYWGFKMVIMMPESFIFRPQLWLENISKYHVTLGVAPNFGYHYCVTRIPESVIANIDLSSWRIALNGAEPVDRNTLNKFLERFKPCGLRGDVFFPVYGMAEDSLAATFPSLDNTTVARRFYRDRLENEHIAVDCNSDDTKVYIELVSVGYPLVGQEVRIADEQAKTLKEREVGEILINSPSLTSGYYKNEEATMEAIKDGWLHSGDMGFILDEMLFISGRRKEIIIRRGKNIYPYDVERIASTVQGVRLGCCAAFDVHNEEKGTEDLILVCETVLKDSNKRDELKENINKEILAKLGITPDDIRIVPKGTIPKTTSGKLQRILCKKIYLEDDFIQKKHKDIFVLIKAFLLSHFHLFRKRLKS